MSRCAWCCRGSLTTVEVTAGLRVATLVTAVGVTASLQVVADVNAGVPVAGVSAGVPGAV